LRGRENLAIGEILQRHLFCSECNEDAIERGIVVHVFLALFALDEVERGTGDVDVPLADQIGHLPVKEREQQGADMRAVHVGVGHDDDTAITQAREVEGAFVLFLVFARGDADAGADGRDEGLDLGVLQHLIEARFFHVDDLALDREDRLETPVAALLGGAAGGIAFHNV